LETIVEFIAADDPDAAVGVLNAIESRAKSLEKMP
jgi:plasmid stabilization system protein ParE